MKCQWNFKLIFALLLAMIWLQWADWTGDRSMEVNQGASDSAIDFRYLEQLSAMLLHWQFTFVAISVGFVVYTGIFWT